MIVAEQVRLLLVVMPLEGGDHDVRDAGYRFPTITVLPMQRCHQLDPCSTAADLFRRGAAGVQS